MHSRRVTTDGFSRLPRRLLVGAPSHAQVGPGAGLPDSGVGFVTWQGIVQGVNRVVID